MYNTSIPLLINATWITITLIYPRGHRIDAMALSLEDSNSKDIQALTAAIKELAYTLNIYIISSLATTENERQYVHDRVVTRHEVKKGG